MTETGRDIWRGWERRSSESPRDENYRSDKKEGALDRSTRPLKAHSNSLYIPGEMPSAIKIGELQVMRKQVKSMHKGTTNILQSLEGKTIEVITLSIDIVNSSEKVRRLSGEEAGEYYQTFIESTSDLIQDYGGHVLKNVGDCVIGFFICSDSSIAEHIRSVLCGLALRQMVKNTLDPHFKKRDLPSIACRISADFGEVRVLRVRSNGGYSAVDLFGRAMNSASKISHYAKPNQMVVGDGLFWKLIDTEYFEFNLINRFDLTGKHTYPVYLVECRERYKREVISYE